MGSSTDLTVASYLIITSKSAVVPETMTIFRETDRRVFTRRVAERNPLVWGEPQCMDDEETEMAIEYACETGKAIDRLNVMGFTMRRVREEFEIGRQKEFERHMSYWNRDSILGKLGRDNSELNKRVPCLKILPSMFYPMRRPFLAGSSIERYLRDRTCKHGSSPKRSWAAKHNLQGPCAQKADEEGCMICLFGLY